MADAELIFPPTDRPDGFTSGDLSEKIGDADTIVRELLQNALDAVIPLDAEVPAEVNITIEERPVSDLPGYRRYRDAFNSAVELRRARPSPPSDAEESVIERMGAALQRSSARVLFCRDNGVGLDQARMINILTDSNTDKEGLGAGSQGVGHNTAFAASDLRYVVYAGRSRHDRQNVVGGQAVLAAHRLGRSTYAPSGLWRLRGGDLFDAQRLNFPSEVPKLMAEQFELIKESGSVVAITGFDDFRMADEAEALEAIKRAAALNFLVAIWRGAMQVRISDGELGESPIITAENLGQVLSAIEAAGYRPENDPTNRLSGEQGRRIEQALSRGREVTGHNVEGATVYLRLIEGEANATSARTQVHLFRDGMWITRRAPLLSARSFSENKPFDAVVMLSSGPLYDLVRRSEGPQHRGIDKPRLSRSDAGKMEGYLRMIQSRLREEAGTLDSDEGYTPDDFALLRGSTVRKAEPRRRRRPRIRPPKPTVPPAPQPEPRPRPAAPNPGPVARIRSRLLPQSADAGQITTLRGQVSMTDAEQAPSRLGLRVYMESGSDESCDEPISGEWRRLKQITCNDQIYTPSNKERPFEVVVPADSSILAIDLVDPIDMALVELLRLDAVGRR